MTCDIADVLIEAVAAGEHPLGGELGAHLSACERCRRALALAREVEAMFRAERQPAVRPELFEAIRTRLHRERWRVEESFDLAFNVVVSLAVVGILAGAYVVVAAAVGGLGAGTLSDVASGMALVAERARPFMSVYAMAVALLAMSAGVWWWAEHGFDV
jgi:predicted anti-sigma-YlaC factor YlaD